MMVVLLMQGGYYGNDGAVLVSIVAICCLQIQVCPDYLSLQLQMCWLQELILYQIVRARYRLDVVFAAAFAWINGIE